MAYTKKDFKVYGEKPLIDTSKNGAERNFLDFSEKSYFDHKKEGGSEFHRKVRWFKIGDSLDHDVEIIAEGIIDLRDYNNGDEIEELSYSDFHNYVKREHPSLYSNNNTKWILNTTTMIEDRDASEKRKNFAFFDVVDDELVVRVVSVSSFLVPSEKRRSGFDIQYDVEDVLFLTVRKRPTFYIYDLNQEVFVKTTKKEVVDGLLDDYKTEVPIDGYLDFVITETIVEGDSLMESLRKSIVEHGTYAEYKDIIKFLMLSPFSNVKAIDGREFYITTVSLTSFYEDVKALNEMLEDRLSRQYVFDMVTRLGFFLDIDVFDSLLPRFESNNIADDMSLEEALEVDPHIVENLAYFIHYEKMDVFKESEKANAFMQFLLTAKNLNEFGIDTTIIIDNMSKLYTNLEFELHYMFKHKMYKVLENKLHNNEVEIKGLKNETVLRIFRASEERFIDMYVIVKMYNRYLDEVKRSDLLKAELQNLSIKEAFDFLFPIDIQLSLNKLGIFGERY